MKSWNELYGRKDETPPWRDQMQVCMSGHVITDQLKRSSQFGKRCCGKCGAKTINMCPECGYEIPGNYHVPGVLSADLTPKQPPANCENYGSEFPWSRRKFRRQFKLWMSRRVKVIPKRLPGSAARLSEWMLGSLLAAKLISLFGFL